MSITASDIAFAEELFEPLGKITHRNMMGGLSIYHDGQIFAILDDKATVFLKAKDAFAERLAAEGSRIFDMDGKTMGYWTMPTDALDDPELASEWARAALDAL